MDRCGSGEGCAGARRQRTRDAKAGVGTLAALLDRYGETEARQLKSWPDSRKRVEHVLSKLLQRPAIGLTVADIQEAIDGHPSASSAAFVVRSVRPVFKWAARAGRGWVLPELAEVVAPADGITLRRKRVLDRKELARLLPVLRTTHRPHGHALLLMLLLLTLARRSEVVAMRHRDVDLEAATWTLADTKNGQRHVVQLSNQAAALLRARMPADAAPDALVFTTGEGAALGHWDRETKAIHKASRTAGWTRHDLRRTGATMLGELGEMPDIVEAALNHVSIRSPLAATYNRSRYAPAVRAALQRLADQLGQIADGAEGAAKQPAPGLSAD